MTTPKCMGCAKSAGSTHLITCAKRTDKHPFVTFDDCGLQRDGSPR